MAKGFSFGMIHTQNACHGLLCVSAGVQAVVNALLVMHHLASTAEAPRKQRSVLSLVLLWLVLLLACVWWIYGRR